MPELAARLSQAYAGRRVLLSGGASFIGSHLAELLVASGAQVTVADDLSSGRREHLASIASRIKLLIGDLRRSDFAEAATAEQEIVFHLAAAHGGRGYIETHPVACANNMLLDHVVYAAAVKNGVRKIVQASSACVYPTNLQASETKRLLLKESDANFEEPGKAFSDGEYGWAKLMGEMQLRAFCKEHAGLTGAACRIFTAYGERENESHAVVALIAKAVAKLDPYPIWGNGLQTRNFTYVRDTVTGLALAGTARQVGFETLNVGTATHHTIMDLMEEIFAALDWRPQQIERQLDKPVGVQSRAADCAKIQSVYGWQPSVGLREGIRATVAWYKNAAVCKTEAALDRLLMERA